MALKEKSTRGLVGLSTITTEDGKTLFPLEPFPLKPYLMGEVLTMHEIDKRVIDERKARMAARRVLIDEETHSESIKPQLRSNCCSQVMIEQLVDMAVNGEVPTGYYSDFECSVWSAIRSVLINNGVDIRDV